jgi:hypothetical protein
VIQQQRLAWIQHWLGAGLQAIEALLAEKSRAGSFATATGQPLRISAWSHK